jgi:hypothetical protein
MNWGRTPNYIFWILTKKNKCTIAHIRHTLKDVMKQSEELSKIRKYVNRYIEEQAKRFSMPLTKAKSLEDFSQIIDKHLQESKKVTKFIIL